ncbi:hypothetical protein NQD34_015899 [Periophthalmus magnuspinnatus]|nr:hypothetical protein NQD34_015899 [Periophthalmus magnuspinnatus]
MQFTDVTPAEMIREGTFLFEFVKKWKKLAPWKITINFFLKCKPQNAINLSKVKTHTFNSTFMVVGLPSARLHGDVIALPQMFHSLHRKHIFIAKIQYYLKKHTCTSPQI